VKLTILDRDGVINRESSAYIKNPDEWLPLPGSLEAIATLNQQGFTVAIATNQSGIARGLYDRNMLARIHQKMHRHCHQVGAHIDFIAYCPHHPNDGCDCRKPSPGLLHQISEHYGVTLHGVPFVGDRLTDIQAGQAVGATPYFLDPSMDSNQTISTRLPPEYSSIPCFPDLKSLVNALSE